MRRATLILAGAIVFVFTLTIQTNAAVPQLINYQGVLTDSAGTGLDTTVNITFTIYDDPSAGSPIWTEVQNITVVDGLFNAKLGEDPFNTMQSSFFSGPLRYLGITVGADPEISPRVQLVSVPYSFHSEFADASLLAIMAENAIYADTATMAVQALLAEIAIFADSARVADFLDTLSSEDFSRTGHSHGGGGGGWTDDGTVVRLDASADSVGIGTSTPSEKLDVVGNIVVSGKATIGSGHTNTGANSFVAGAINTASGDWASVSGGQFSVSSANYSVVGGGLNDTASGTYSTVSGGRGSSASASYATVGGGNSNKASQNWSTVGGGRGNSASFEYATVAGGNGGVASGTNSFVGSGFFNTASGPYAVVTGGRSNVADTAYASVGGGFSNLAGGYSATVPGGRSNSAAGIYSFAAGRRAKATHHGAFVWADSTDANFASTADNQFSIRAKGGTRIYSNSALSAGVTLAAGASAWASVSDSALKRNIREVDYQDVLEKLNELPISQWSYEAQDESIEHIGPMAQDFYRLFGLGEDDRHISTLDPDGISLAAIKALYNENKELKKQIQSVQAESREEIRKLEKLLKKLLDSR